MIKGGNSMDLRQRLLRLKAENGLTTEALSERSGIPKGTINKLLNGETRNPTGQTLRRLAQALNCPLETLYGETNARRAARLREDALEETEIVPICKRRIPVLGEIAAGKPIQCAEEAEVYAPIAGEEQCDVALRVHGDSMSGARLPDGDLVFSRAQEDVLDGQIAAVVIDGEATLKRVYHIPNGVRLVSENAKYAPMVFSYPAQDTIRILGLAIAFSGAIV